jgi:hypothetical protein
MKFLDQARFTQPWLGDDHDQLAVTLPRPLPQVLMRQTRENCLVYLVLAECRLVFPEAQAPQPDHDVHNLRPQSVLRASWFA